MYTHKHTHTLSTQKTHKQRCTHPSHNLSNVHLHTHTHTCRTHDLLLTMLRPLLALPASSPKPLPPKLWVALVRCLQPMAQLLAKAQDPALVQQVMCIFIIHVCVVDRRRVSIHPLPQPHIDRSTHTPHAHHPNPTHPNQAMALLTHSLAVPACCPYTVEAVRTLASRCGGAALDPSTTITPLLHALHTTPLTSDEAATLAAALLPLLQALETTAETALAHPVLQRLAAAAEAPPDSHFTTATSSSSSGGGTGRHRLLADVAIADTLLRRLPPDAALQFLSQVRG
jgi:hypothetical protein